MPAGKVLFHQCIDINYGSSFCIELPGTLTNIISSYVHADWTFAIRQESRVTCDVACIGFVIAGYKEAYVLYGKEGLPENAKTQLAYSKPC